MTGTVHELFPDAVAASEPSTAPPLPVMPHVAEIIIQLERLRATSEQALAVMRSCPTLTSATTEFLNQIMDHWVRASEANDALASILSCKGQA
jgi:hypothetical protein